jgi:hypothetical protein
METRVCTVRGQDHRGYPLRVHVEAGSLFEAAARGMEQIMIAGGQPSELEVTQHVPKQAWKVSPEKLLKWASQRGANDNIGVQSIKRKLQDFLGPKA